MPFCSKGCRTSSGKRMWHDKRHPCPMEAAGKLKAARAEEAAKPAGGPPDPHPLPEPTVAEGKAPGEAKTPPTTETKPTATEKTVKLRVLAADGMHYEYMFTDGTWADDASEVSHG